MPKMPRMMKTIPTIPLIQIRSLLSNFSESVVAAIPRVPSRFGPERAKPRLELSAKLQKKENAVSHDGLSEAEVLADDWDCAHT
jgi:hypothetical protein